MDINRFSGLKTIEFKGTDKVLMIRLFNDSRLIPDHSVITRILVKTRDQTFDSDVTPALFEIQTSHIGVIFGQLFTNVGVYKVCLTTFDPSNVNGVTWTDNLTIDLREC